MSDFQKIQDDFALVKTGLAGEFEGQSKKDSIRERLLAGTAQLSEDEERLGRIKALGKDTHLLMQDANAVLYQDREGLVRIMSRQAKMNQDLEQAQGVVIAIER